MINTSDFRKGLRILVDDEPYSIVDFQHSKVARGGAKIWTKLKNIRTGATVEKTFTPNDKFNPPDMEFKNMQYLYENTGEYTFMDSTTFEQINIDADHLGDAKWYLIENDEYKVIFLDGKPFEVELPTSVILEVIETEPSARGDTVSNVTKPAKVKTGLEVKVPPFIKEGDSIKIDTRSGEYLERAN